MKVPTRAGAVTVLSFPADDAELAQRLRELVDDLTARDTDPFEIAQLLERSLRHIYPHVTTRRRALLAGFGDTVVYLFRDGGAASALADDDWQELHTTARLVTDETGRYRDANEAAAELFGASRGAILGSRAGAFTEPDARVDDADALWQALRLTGRLHSLAVVRRADGARVPVEFVTVRDGDGPGRNVTYIRALL